ncbi:hypothetical protein D3C78_1587220 [compost metagenome]
MLGNSCVRRSSMSNCRRGSSHSNTVAPLSCRPWNNSSRRPQLLSGTHTAAQRWVATKATNQAGWLRMAIATRSPGRTP